MISTYDVRKWINENEKSPCYEKEGLIYNKDDNKELCSFEDFTNQMRKKLHCDFECIFYEHATLDEVLRCKECGAVIFTGDDERYDPNLVCPVCGGYKHSHYWSAEDIANDVDKQKQIEAMKEYMEEKKRAEARREARGGLYDWELWKKDFYGEKYYLGIELYHLTGYDIEFRFGKKMENSLMYTTTKHFKIPLSPRAIFILWIYPVKRTINNWRKQEHENC